MPDGRSVRFRDLRITDTARKASLMAAVERVLDHGVFIMGPEVAAFEERFAEFCGVKYAVGLSSGTSALYLALRALKIGPGDEVITTPMSWIATVNCIHATGAKPVFADIGSDLNIDPKAVAAAIGPRTKAILPVHYTGRMCDMMALGAIARENKLLIVEDAAQAAGARFKGQPAGTFSDAAAFSFNPMKVFCGYGEGGATVTNSLEVRERLLALRYLGTVERELCIDPELNHKIDSLQAAMLMETFPYLSGWIERRVELARQYSAALGNVVGCPSVSDDRRSVFFDYTITADDRDELMRHLLAQGIEVKIKHPLLMCDQPPYKERSVADIPHARETIGRILTLPLHEKMTDGDVEFVVAAILEFYGAN